MWKKRKQPAQNTPSPRPDKPFPPGTADDALPPGVEPSPEAKAAAEPEKLTLLQALRQVQTPEQARELVQVALQAASGKRAEEIREQEGDTTDHTRRVREAAMELGVQRTGELILEAAREVAGSSGETREALEEAFQEATNPEQQGQQDPTLERALGLIRAELLNQMRPVQSLDARLFLLINHLPHTKETNRAMYGLTRLMNGGWGWVLGLIVAAILDGRRGRRALHSVVTPLWFATMTVEFPVKSYFRRRRPFIDVVQAISVGRKPGTYSFPSGHSASSFAGAWLVSRHYPELSLLWFSIATLVAFSRIYVGAHYPGDVVSGAIAGLVIAEATRRVTEYENNGVSA
jgi:undecaprenyl-diphosphatase